MNKMALTLAALLASTSHLHAQSQSQTNDASAQNSAGAAINQNFEGAPEDQRVETTPGVYAPGLDAGTNNCAISASAGGSVTGFGLSVGASWESEDCNERNWIALMSARGWDDVAQAYACLNNPKAAAAFEAAGYDCPERAQRERKTTENTTKTGGSVPEWCDDGGWASEEAIREKCPNAERLLGE